MEEKWDGFLFKNRVMWHGVFVSLRPLSAVSRPNGHTNIFVVAWILEDFLCCITSDFYLHEFWKLVSVHVEVRCDTEYECQKQYFTDLFISQSAPQSTVHMSDRGCRVQEEKEWKTETEKVLLVFLSTVAARLRRLPVICLQIPDSGLNREVMRCDDVPAVLIQILCYLRNSSRWTSKNDKISRQTMDKKA